MKIRLRKGNARARDRLKGHAPIREVVASSYDSLLHGLTPADLHELERRLEASIEEVDPVAFVTTTCGEHIWSKQREVLESVRDHRKTAVPSCHGTGKSFISARVIAWWVVRHELGKSFVVTSAPTSRQVRVILWREIGRLHAKARLLGRTNQTEWMATMPAGNEEVVAFGMKPEDASPTAFQGIHARFVLVVFDEACGIVPELWIAADSLVANDDSRFLAIGNPDFVGTEFEAICKPGSGWHVIAINAFESPNFTGEELPLEVKAQLIGRIYVEERRRKWAPTWRWTDDGRSCVPPNRILGNLTMSSVEVHVGNSLMASSVNLGGENSPTPADVYDPKDLADTNPFWQSKVLGRFPVQGTLAGLIPAPWILSAQRRTLLPSTPIELGIDPGAGGDETAVALRQGQHYRI